MPRRPIAAMKSYKPAQLYYTLLSQDALGGPWRIEFGDYCRPNVVAEMQDMKDSDRFQIARRVERPRYRILAHTKPQLEAVALFNSLAS